MQNELVHGPAGASTTYAKAKHLTEMQGAASGRSALGALQHPPPKRRKPLNGGGLTSWRWMDQLWA